MICDSDRLAYRQTSTKATKHALYINSVRKYLCQLQDSFLSTSSTSPLQTQVQHVTHPPLHFSHHFQISLPTSMPPAKPILPTLSFSSWPALYLCHSAPKLWQEDALWLQKVGYDSKIQRNLISLCSSYLELSCLTLSERSQKQVGTCGCIFDCIS